MLSFSRVTNAEEAFVVTDLNKILDTLKNDFELIIREKKAVINYPVMPAIKGIPMQLSQLFSNLIANSLKYNDKSPVINISVEKLLHEEVQEHPKLDKKNSYFKIQFADNGIGFEKEYRELIFNILSCTYRSLLLLVR